MPLSPKKHDKLNNSKHAAVSLDSFLGLLSSAYGTEQLDSSIIFEKDTVNWSNISVENLKTYNKKDETVVKVKKDKSKEFEKVSTGTSTTNLRTSDAEDDEKDETLFSIRSLVSLQKVTSKPDNKKELNGDTVQEASFSALEENGNQIEDPKDIGDNINKNHTSITPVCGFYVDDSDHKVVFDIQFVKRDSTEDEIIPVFEIGEPEILITIIDTLKPMQASLKVAKCSLVSKVKYFAEVEKEFGLDGLDVVVKCNFGVFQWVLQWIMSDIPMCRPNLNPTNLKAILSMANNLGINQLVEECLDYFRQNFSLVLGTDHEIEDALDDNLFHKLTIRFSNSEVEQISDDFERIKTRLFCSLIKLLADPEPCEKIGHFSSLAKIFQCGFCRKILHADLTDCIPCRVDCSRLKFDGRLEYRHECSSFWSLSKYIEAMYDDAKEWRIVYWQLWGMCHFSFCEVCQTWYPLSQSDWCPYHPGQVEYFPMKNNMFHPIGTYGCCGEKTFKYDVIKPYSGCKHKAHVSKLDTMEKVEVFNVHQEFKHLINIPPIFVDSSIKRFVKIVKNDDFSNSQIERTNEGFWWSGILLAPEEKKDYSLISLKVLNFLRNRKEYKKEPKKHFPLKFGTNVPFGRIIPLEEKPPEHDYLEELPSTSKQAHGKKTRPKFNVKKGKSSSITLGMKNKTKKNKSLLYTYQPLESVWTDVESNKDNQDNQRDFEEIAMRKLVQILTPADCSCSTQESSAGSYIRLETDWWQRNCRSHTDKTSSTVVNRTFPLSWFRRLTI